MKRLDSAIHFSCPEHPSRNIEGLDPTPGVRKKSYCVNCILESEDPKALYNIIQTFPDFLDHIAQLYDQKKRELLNGGSPFEKFFKMTQNKVESVNNLRNHIQEQKKKIEECFIEIKRIFDNKLEQKKNEYLKVLDQQVINLASDFDFFEKDLKQFYPSQEELDLLYPSRSEIEARFKGLRNTSELDEFVEKMKTDLEQNNQSIEKIFATEFKQNAFDHFRNQIISRQTRRPAYEANLQVLHEKVTKSLNQDFESIFKLSNPIILEEARLIITAPSELTTIRDWLPNKYQQNFYPRLIYKGLRDGFTAESFQSKCNKKQPTITLIKGTFENSSQVVVIGGFLDKAWNTNGIYILSRDAFIFSLTSKIKCPIADDKSVAFACGEPIFAFGAGHDIAIYKDLNQSYVFPHSYTNAAQIVQSPTYKGSGKILFLPIDVEVYTI